MTIVATTKHPTVQISDGLRIDDAFAERLVEKMLISLDTSYGLVNFEMHEDKIRRASLGNPKGQKRIFKRMCKAGHELDPCCRDHLRHPLPIQHALRHLDGDRVR